MSKLDSVTYFLPVLNLIWLATCLFSVIHVAFYGDPIFLLYSLIVATLLAILVIFVLSIIRKKSDYAKGYTPLVFILGIYLVIVSWIGMNMTFPEYQEIVKFDKLRSELTYKLNVKRGGANMGKVYRWEMAKLYLNAPKSVNKVEASVNHKGTMMMHILLMDKIGQGDGELYSDDMYAVAEVAFTIGKDFSQEWYERAYEHGREDALRRFRERMLEVNPRYKIEEEINANDNNNQ